MNDDLFEASFENFSVTLSTGVTGLQLDSDIATVTIEDDDSELELTIIVTRYSN